MKKIYVYDAYNNWEPALRAACLRNGWECDTLKLFQLLPMDGWLFIRPSMKPGPLAAEKDWICSHKDRSDLHWITDTRQILHYENKVRQAQLLQHALPKTQIATGINDLKWINVGFPCVSKASVGASSQFVRIIPDREALLREAKMIFSPQGYPLNSKTWPNQQGYMYLQEFLPDNEYTLRVNIVGNQVAVWKRYNYPDKPVAQTGNAEAVNPLDYPNEVEFAREVAFDIGSKWCALDILTHEGEFYCLETSLGWPWPGVGGGVFAPSGAAWEDMFDVLLEEIDDGAFPA